MGVVACLCVNHISKSAHGGRCLDTIDTFTSLEMGKLYDGPFAGEVALQNMEKPHPLRAGDEIE